MLPTGSYKTTTFGGFSLYHGMWVPSAKVTVGASTRDQAAILYEQAKGFVERSKFLALRYKVQDGYKRIRGIGPCLGSVIRVYSSDDGANDGVIPSLALIDELHRHKGHDLYGTWRDKLTKRKGQMVTLSTAGDSEENPLEQLREAARQLAEAEVLVEGRHTVVRSDDGGFCMHEWALKPGDDIDDLKIVKEANPAGNVTEAELKMRRDSPSTKLWQWERFTCNLRAKGEESAIPPPEFDARCFEGVKIGPKVPTWVGMDLAWKIDHTALVPVGWEDMKRRVVAGAVTLAPPVSEFEIVRHLLLMAEALNVRGIVYDPNAGGQQMVQQLETGTHELLTDDDVRVEAGLPLLADSKVKRLRFIEHSQDNGPMAVASVRLDEAWRYGWIRHDGARKCATKGCRCGGFRGHVINAVTKPLGGEKWKYDRPADAHGSKRSRFPIDALTALEIGHSVAVAERDPSIKRIRVADMRIRTV